MDKKVCVVTGSSKGIGANIIKKFAMEGYNVVINYNTSESKAMNLKREVEEKYNVEALVVPANVAIEEDVKYMVECIIKQFGKIDVLVNNAGISIDSKFEDKSANDFRKILGVNLIGTFLMCKYISKYMKERESGCIINISSTNGIDTLYPESMDYDASKAGIISLTRNLAKELSPNIRVNSVAPGWVETEMNSKLSEEFKNEETNKIFMGRFAKPMEIANVVYFLSTNDASYINGTTIRVDGGY